MIYEVSCYNVYLTCAVPRVKFDKGAAKCNPFCKIGKICPCKTLIFSINVREINNKFPENITSSPARLSHCILNLHPSKH